MNASRSSAITLGIALLFASQVVIAGDDEAAREELQRQLNQQVMASPFNPGDIQKAEAYAAEAKRNNQAPVLSAPRYWSPGWTCASMAGYRYYNYYDYRNCVYYHHYYGRYWP